MNLVPYNSKVVPEIKALADALVAIKVNGIKSQHELIKDMLGVYEEKYPHAFEQARRYMALTNGKIDEPLDKKEYK